MVMDITHVSRRSKWVIEAAGLPLVRVLTARSYETRELAATILPHLKPR